MRACREVRREPGVSLGFCEHCGMSLMNNYVCTSKDGKKFTVGSECVMKCGFAPGLSDAVEIAAKKIERKVRKARAEAKDAAVVAEWNTLISDEINKVKLAAKIVPGNEWRKENTLLEGMTWLWARCGAAGRSRTLKTLKEHLTTLNKGD